MSRIGVAELAKILMNKHKLSAADAERFVRLMFDTVNDGLQDDKQVKIKGLGTFKVTAVKDRESVDVNTGERIVIEGREKISFTPDTIVKDIVNKPFAQFETVELNDGVDFDAIDEKYAETEEETHPIGDGGILAFRHEKRVVKPATKVMEIEPEVEDEHEEMQAEGQAAASAAKPHSDGILAFRQQLKSVEENETITSENIQETVDRQAINDEERDDAEVEVESGIAESEMLDDVTSVFESASDDVTSSETTPSDVTPSEITPSDVTPLVEAAAEKAVFDAGDSESVEFAAVTSGPGEVNSTASLETASLETVERQGIKDSSVSSSQTEVSAQLTNEEEDNLLQVSSDKSNIKVEMPFIKKEEEVKVAQVAAASSSASASEKIAPEYDEEESEEKAIRMPMSRLVALICCIVIVLGGACFMAYQYGKSMAIQMVQQPVAQAPVKKKPAQPANPGVSNTVLQKAKEDSIRMQQTAQAVAMAEKAAQQEQQKETKQQQTAKSAVGEVKNTPAKSAASASTKTASVSAKTTSVSAKTTSTKVAEKSQESSKVSAPKATTKYDSDPRIRTGAYAIMGVDKTITVRKGQTLAGISKSHLGPGMECYIEALNGAGPIKEGQKIKIPKLVLKKRLK